MKSAVPWLEKVIQGSFHISCAQHCRTLRNLLRDLLSLFAEADVSPDEAADAMHPLRLAAQEAIQQQMDRVLLPLLIHSRESGSSHPAVAETFLYRQLHRIERSLQNLSLLSAALSVQFVEDLTWRVLTEQCAAPMAAALKLPPATNYAYAVRSIVLSCYCATCT